MHQPSSRAILAALGLATAAAGFGAPVSAQDSLAAPESVAQPGGSLMTEPVAVEPLAAEPYPVGAPAPAGPAARFTIGAGAAYVPDYFGAEDYSFTGAGTLRFDYVRLPGGIEFGSTGAVGFTEGFGPRGSLRYIGSRDSSDNAELRGLEDVDAALELGLGLGYDAAYWRAFANLRYGVIGHSAWVGDFGADAILRPNDNLIVNFGPRANWGGSGFMNSYFRVSDSEAGESGLDAYDPDPGFYSVGVELNARYAFSENWGVEGTANYDRLIADAADSPIVGMGTQNQFGLQVLLTRSLSLGF